MFSYDEYKEIIRLVMDSKKACDYEEALLRDRFIIVRHDVEFSVARAHALSQVEDSLGFASNYFFQWTNNNYNLLSQRNTDIIRDMAAHGHRIGLHYATCGLGDIAEIRQSIIKEANILSEMLDLEIKQFSIHRPSMEILKANIKLPGLINAYQDEFFTVSENAENASDLAVKYISDSRHIWRFGYPDAATISGFDKLQLLFHPFAWTAKGYDNLENYKALIGEKYLEMIDSIDRECKDFGEYRMLFNERNPF